MCNLHQQHNSIFILNSIQSFFVVTVVSGKIPADAGNFDELCRILLSAYTFGQNIVGKARHVSYTIYSEIFTSIKSSITCADDDERTFSVLENLPNMTQIIAFPSIIRMVLYRENFNNISVKYFQNYQFLYWTLLINNKWPKILGKFWMFWLYFSLYFGCLLNRQVKKFLKLWYLFHPSQHWTRYFKPQSSTIWFCPTSPEYLYFTEPFDFKKHATPQVSSSGSATSWFSNLIWFIDEQISAFTGYGILLLILENAGTRKRFSWSKCSDPSSHLALFFMAESFFNCRFSIIIIGKNSTMINNPRMAGFLYGRISSKRHFVWVMMTNKNMDPYNGWRFPSNSNQPK